MRNSKCKICRSEFIKRSMSHKTCKPECAMELVRQNKEKAERKAIKKKLIELEPLSYWEKKAEKACNTYVRYRDRNEPCISCDSPTSYPYWQAGHYVSVGANSTLRYDEENIHKQCVYCNMHKGSNAIRYRINLLIKIGVEGVERLEGWHAPIKRTIEDVQAIEAHYKDKLKQLKDQENTSPQ